MICLININLYYYYKYLMYGLRKLKIKSKYFSTIKNFLFKKRWLMSSSKVVVAYHFQGNTIQSRINESSAM